MRRRLWLCLCGIWRAAGLDHRLESGLRTWHSVRSGGEWLVGLSQQRTRGRRRQPARRIDQGSGRRRIRKCAGDGRHSGFDAGAVCRREAERQTEPVYCVREGCGHRHFHCGGHFSREHRIDASLHALRLVSLSARRKNGWRAGRGLASLLRLSRLSECRDCRGRSEQSDLMHPFMPYGWFRYQPDGKTVGVLAAASLLFFAYRGFQNVAIAVEEANNPQRDMPIAIIGSLGVCTVLYLAVSGLLTAIAPYDVLNVSSPVAFALLRLGYNWGSALVAVGVIIGLTSTMLVLY